jgi:putative ABC transport system permease protein
VYGVIADATTRRRHELGVRLALGARPAQVIALVLRDGAVLVATGLASGIGGAAIAAPWLQGQLFGVAPHDLPSFVIAVAAIALAAMLACWMPAWRATKINPRATLGVEGGV